jgi:hypothetical protein
MRKAGKIEGKVIRMRVNSFHEAKSLCRQNAFSDSQEIPDKFLEPLSSLPCLHELAIDWSII